MGECPNERPTLVGLAPLRLRGVRWGADGRLTVAGVDWAGVAALPGTDDAPALDGRLDAPDPAAGCAAGWRVAL
eukprot:gene20875-18006_t